LILLVLKPQYCWWRQASLMMLLVANFCKGLIGCDMIPWNTPTGLYPMQICKRKHALGDETNNITQCVSFCVLSTQRHQHWTGCNWMNFHLFPANDTVEHISWNGYDWNRKDFRCFFSHKSKRITHKESFRLRNQRIAWTTSQIHMRKLNTTRGLFSDCVFDGLIQLMQTSFLHRLNCIHYAWTIGEWITFDGWQTVSDLLYDLCLSVVYIFRM
jgi:hypothetical protein